MSLSKSESTDDVDVIINKIRQAEETETLAREVRELTSVLRAMGALLTPEQCARLKNMDEIKCILEQDNSPAPLAGCCGSIGGFGTEELEEYQRMLYQPIP